MGEVMIEDEGLVRFAKMLGKPLVTLRDIREKQNVKMCSETIDRARDKLKQEGLGKVSGEAYFAGSVDFMVTVSGGEKRFSIIETNGGNSRGLSLLPARHTEMALESYTEMLRFMPDRPNILVGHLSGDKVLHEKFMIAESFHQALKPGGAEPGFAVAGEEKDINGEGPTVVAGAYPDILPGLEVRGGYAFLGDLKLHGIIGDGVIRRHDELNALASSGELKTLFANKVYKTTDDKYLTYKLVEKYKEPLSQLFRVHPLRASLCGDQERLRADMADFFDSGIHPVIIKPHGGSGGAGIYAVSDLADMDEILDRSKAEFRAKFGDGRNPFPYTLVEAVNFDLIRWNDSDRNFDIRIYVGRRGDSVIPLGLLLRIARSPFRGMDDKEGFVVNLSGYGGIETERGMGLSTEALEIFELTRADIVDMFAASCAVFDLMVRELGGGR